MAISASAVPPLSFAVTLSAVFAGRARSALEALAAIDAELALAVRPGIEHAVAHAKLGWWRAEIDRLHAGHPEHPLTRALRAAAGEGPDYALLHERLAAADLALAGFAPATLAELEALLYRSHGAQWQLAAEILAAAPGATAAAYGAALGKGLGLVELLAGRPPAPPPGVARPVLAARAAALLDAAEAALPASGRAAQAPGFVAAALARAMLASLARERAIAQAPRPPAAVTQLCIAWRAARRARHA
jgi:phytoene synthase